MFELIASRDNPINLLRKIKVSPVTRGKRCRMSYMCLIVAYSVSMPA